MLSVLITASERDEERLARTLASLVPAVVEGVLREVIVVARDSAAETIAVAEHAGCGLAATLAAAVEAAKGEWLLFLPAGARLREGWSESVLAHAAERGGAARFTADAPFVRRVVLRFRHRKSPFSRGLLIGRRQAAQAAGSGPEGQPFLRPKRLHRLAARMALPE